MDREIYLDANRDEERIAITEKGKLVDLHIKRAEETKNVGNIYLGVIQNVLEGINSCFVDIGTGKNAFLPLSDYPGDIRKGERIIIQVTKEELHEKGAKVTGKISLPGRHIVYMPGESGIGVSRNIKNKEKRDILRDMLKGLAPEGGFVARTNSQSLEKREIIKEAKYLVKLWKNIRHKEKRARREGKPQLIYRETSMVFYALRELFDENTKVFYINNFGVFKDTMAFIRRVDPSNRHKIKFYKSDVPLFERYNLESQIENLKRRKISLQCGGYIIIEQTEALTAIDVNTGSYTKGSNREETALKVDIEAAKVAASQIILRDIGGIIIIDFIDLDNKNNRLKILNVLRDEMKSDIARIKIFPMTRLGLIEITRQRRKESIVDILCRPCPYCEGSGMIFSETTMYIKIKRELLRKGKDIPSKYINLFLHPRVADIFDEKGFSMIEKELDKKIKLRRDYKMHHEEFKIST